MRITDALYGEHGSLYMLMDAIEARLAESDLATLQSSAALFETAILAHAHFENDPFFTALDRVMPGGGPVAAMRAEHEEIEGELAKVATSRDAGDARLHLEAAIAEARSHFQKEELVLFPMAEQLLGTDALEEMGAAWAQNRGVALPAARRVAMAAGAAMTEMAASAARVR
jgi:hemerythrin-like domain-containing protein